MRSKFIEPLRQLPRSPEELQEALTTVFPTFAAELPNEHEDAEELGEKTFHSIVMDFAPYFARTTDLWTDRQLRWLGELVVAAMAENGKLGNAWDTCFLEHTRQLKANRRVAPWLASARAKRGS